MYTGDEKSNLLRRVASDVAEDRFAAALSKGEVPSDFRGTAGDYFILRWPDTEEANLVAEAYQIKITDNVKSQS